MEKRKLIAGLFLLSGATGLVYEIVWFRMLALSLGSTAQALSTVTAVYLGGLAVGAFAASWILQRSRWTGLRWYGIAEVLTGAYALMIPTAISWTTPALATVYASDGPVTLIRVGLCALVVGPATVMMGTSLPFLAAWSGRNGTSTLYALNLLGATIGALLCGFALLPAFGFWQTLLIGCCLNLVVGIIAFVYGGVQENRGPAPANAASATSVRCWELLAFSSGFLFLLFEVTWSRVGGLLFGPTTSTVTLVLATFLAGLALSAWIARGLHHHIAQWLCAAQLSSVLFLLWAYQVTRVSPHWVGRWVTAYVDQPARIELLKLALFGVTIVPLAFVCGLVFPLLLRLVPPSGAYSRYAGGVYGINTLGCIAGSLLTGWVLIPFLGTQATVVVGAVLSGSVGLWLLKEIRPAWLVSVASSAAVLLVLTVFVLPHWNMELLTAGGYKYAPYGSAEGIVEGGQLALLREGTSGTVVVRKRGGFTILAIDGKVDASDAGGDLLTEKLLAHLPLLLNQKAKSVCLIGLASGVTAGAVLSHPVERLDVLEVSPEVVEASHFFDAVAGRPLENARTKLILNDGRNHMQLSARVYDMIISEPSNPWIAGMNNLFTRDFFEIAKARLTPGGLFAQWFHIYNMPSDDLRSLLRSFHEVFPSSALWRLNDGDVLLTGWNGPASWPPGATLPVAALADLRRGGVDDPELLWRMFVMRDADIGRFASGAPANTDDHPWLEFHGQRNLHTQTDSRNADDLESFDHSVADPEIIANLRQFQDYDQLLASGKTFERAESFRSAFRNYAAAFRMRSGSIEALAGMDRCARQPSERRAVTLALGLPAGAPDSLQIRTETAVHIAQAGDLLKAQSLFEENVAAHPQDPGPLYNYGVFTLQRNEFPKAISLFEETIAIDSRHIKAREGIAEAYLKLRDYQRAEEWSRKILQIDPNHVAARQIVEAIQRAAKQ